MRYAVLMLVMFGGLSAHALGKPKSGPAFLIRPAAGLTGACRILEIQADYALIMLPGYTTRAGLALVPCDDVISVDEVSEIQAARKEG